jgi:4-hydroxy-tetrahydrodipicolinate reductase
MKIALLGYGKMGQTIEKIALDRGHEIVLKKTSSNSFEGLSLADVAIEFSVPNAAVANITESLNAGVPTISGTTGWLKEYHEMEKLCLQKNTAFLYGSNFSLGVNLFFELNEHLSKIMSKFDQYKVSMEEVHHTQKLDAPSGTAITLANSIINNTNYDDWSIENPLDNELFINVIRQDKVPGTHTVTYDSTVDSIAINHTAHNREGFALGAILAAEWIVGKKGVFTMKDVLAL